MWHDARYWQITDVADTDTLAEMLAYGGNWTLCSGFRLGGYLFLNDSTSENGAQEYAIVRESDRRQVESITFGWCDRERARHHIEAMLAGEECWVDVPPLAADRLETPERHGRCPHCA